jgi:hypothetical protein
MKKVGYIDAMFDIRCSEQDIKQVEEQLRKKNIKYLVDYKVKRIIIFSLDVYPRLFKQWKIQSYNII